MNKYYSLLGLHIDDVKCYFDNEKIEYSINFIEGKKDRDKLIIPRVIKISEKGDSVEITATYFSDSLI
ncbi:hypothetical protein EXD82_04005 [Peptacetobacter hominis]|uniref:Uncharacterized protein n=1 Tax=Peptacetobacter hominis TaxID=2743610 RepID=A0A544QWE0_9FIRM|nr:hypothetical protein [Peptacetobacter hominis]TQQ85017.1 hypothetical protein EXD82_04005 [Peptacetobacter hominis]